MKRDPLDIAVVVMLVLVVIVGGPYALKQIRGPEPVAGSVAAEKATATQRKVTLGVKGMMCGTCVETITNALQATPGVASAEVDLSSGRAVVLCARALADTALVGAIERSDSLYTAHVTAF